MRNIGLTRLAGRLRKQGRDEAEIMAALLAAPERDGLPESECRSIARSIAKKPTGERHDGDDARPNHADALHELASRRGLSPAALHKLGAIAKGPEVHFPMRDATGNVTGWRRRRCDGRPFAGGKKALTVRGGRNGVMMPWPLPPTGEVLICEGEMDAAAALSTDPALAVIGTPGATPGTAALESLQRVCAGRTVVLASDPDAAGNGWREQLGESLRLAGCAVHVIHPLPGLDMEKRLARVSDLATRKAKLAELIETAATLPLKSPGNSNEKPQTHDKAGFMLLESAFWQPFPLDVLPPVAAAFCKDQAASGNCDPAFVALPLLAALAAAIGDSRALAIKSSWAEPAVLWCMTIAPSTAGKSPAMTAALKAIHRAEAREHEQHKEALRMHEIELANWKVRKPNERGPEPKPPVAVRRVVSDATIEVLGCILEENPRGLLLARDEIAGWLASFNQYKAGGKGSDLQNWLSIHSAGRLIVDRKSSARRTLHVPRALVSICGGIQPDVLREHLKPEFLQSGLAARLLLAMPPRLRRRWTDAEPNPAILARVSEIFERLMALEHHDDGEGERCPVLIKMDADARTHWVAFYNQHHAAGDALEGDQHAAHGKLDSAAARIALVLHLTRAAEVGREAADLDGAGMARGITLARWFAHEAQRVYASLKETLEGRQRRELVERIQVSGGTITTRELMQGCTRFRHSADLADAALTDLASAGLGEWLSEDSGRQGPGRPAARRFRLHPSEPAGGVTEFSDQAEEQILVTLPAASPIEHDATATA